MKNMFRKWQTYFINNKSNLNFFGDDYFFMLHLYTGEPLFAESLNGVLPSSGVQGFLI